MPLVQDWWAELVAADAKVCNHTSHFAHWFMPHVQCPSKELLPEPSKCGKAQDGQKWVCGIDSLKAPCVVYSFGSHENTCFESAMAGRTACEIHIFDPTSRSVRNPRWTYHRWGIAGDDKADTRYWRFFGRHAGSKHVSCAGCEMKTLAETMQTLGHGFIDLLKVDVDGAEWRAYESAFRSFPRGLPIGQLQFEFSGDDLRGSSEERIATFFQRMFSTGFSLFHLETNHFTCWVGKSIAPSVEYAFVNLTHFGLRSSVTGDGRSRRRGASA
jgi:hypothetical protein